MKSPKALSMFLSALILAALACNIGFQAPSSDSRAAAATIVAMTLSAQGLPTSTGTTVATPFISPVAPTPTVKPTLHINANNAKCRSGPSQDSKVIATFNAGATVDMIAKDTADGYWIVKDPGSGDTCWVRAQDATPGGSFDSLPEVTPQASAQSVPTRPGSLFYNYSCDNTSVTTTLTWADAANNENGYRVYRLGNLIADLPANSTAYADTANVPFGTQLTYSVEAYNDAGASAQRSVTFTCK